MATITGTVTYNTVVTITAASGGDATTIAGMLNGRILAGVSATTAAVATAASSVVTVVWPQTAVRAGNGLVHDAVNTAVGLNHALTAPITITVATSATIS